MSGSSDQSALPNPETLPVIVLHRGADTLVYCSQPCLIVEIDESVPHDRMFVWVSGRAPVALFHGPLGYTDEGGPESLARKKRFVDWLASSFPNVVVGHPDEDGE